MAEASPTPALYNPPPDDTPLPAPAPPTTSKSSGDPLLVKDVVACKISERCRSEAKLQPYKPLNCKDDDFDCLCSTTRTLEGNRFFDPHCVFTECTDTEARKAWITNYTQSCINMFDGGLWMVPYEWKPYAPSPRPSATRHISSTLSFSTTVTPPSTTTTDITAQSESVGQSDSTTMTSSTVMPRTMTSFIPADQQVPICGIDPKCMKKSRFMCGAENLECICNSSNSFANNTQFDQQCVFDACYGDIGLREFLNNLVYHCKKINKDLVDIPDRWKVYLPASGTTPVSSAPSAATITTPPTIIHVMSPSHLSNGAYGGIAVGILAAIAGLALMALAYWRTKKKAKDLTRQNAILADQTNPEGMSRRIFSYRPGGSASTLGTTLVATGRPETRTQEAYSQDVYGQGIHGHEASGHGTNGQESYAQERYSESVYVEETPGPTIYEQEMRKGEEGKFF